VNRIGVSAISSDVMMQWWAEMISTEPNHLDVAGKGYHVHPMWTKLQVGHRSNTKWGSWVNVRETSFNFGWKGYELHIRE